MAALLVVSATMLTLVTPPTEQAAAAARPAGLFASVRDKSASVVRAETHQRVAARVRVLNPRTRRPARGRVWFIDADGVRISTKVKLGVNGWAVVTKDPSPGTVPGTYRWRVKFGGNRNLRPAVSPVAATFRVAMPPRDNSVNNTWAASPDILNEDIGDVSGMPGYDPDYGNSWNQQTEDSLRWAYDTIASHDPDAFLVPGDLVQGRWGLPGNTSGLFGTPDDPVQMVENMAAFYHGENVGWLTSAGLFDRTYAAVGDHDIGDNPWDDRTDYGTFKRNNLGVWREEFEQSFYYRSNGSPKFFSRPDPASQWGRTAYATMLDPDLLLVSLDVFDRSGGTVKARVRGAQLAWLTDVLARARRQGVRWIIVQGHTPILPARRFNSSGLHIVGGTDSDLWKVLVKYRVNVYLAGEVHATTRKTVQRVTQLVTGAPIASGVTHFVTVDVFDDRMQITDHGWDVPTNAPSVGLWQGGCSIPTVLADPSFTDHPECAFSRVSPGSRDYSGIDPTVDGRLTVFLDGRTTVGSGSLTQYAEPAPWRAAPGEAATSDPFGLD